MKYNPSCLQMNKSALFVPGVWGPYYSAILPELWVAEGGQTSAGKLVSTTNICRKTYLLETESSRKNNFLYKSAWAEQMTNTNWIV